MNNYTKSTLMFLLAVFCVSLLTGVSTADDSSVPLPLVFDWQWPYTGTDVLTLFCMPDGSGPPFALAKDANGDVADATISAILYQEGLTEPIAYYPAEDMWLESSDHNLHPCNAGTTPDANTDENGMAIWSLPLNAGGWSDTGCLMIVNGDVTVGPTPSLHFNSADIDGNLTVNLDDLALFTTIYYDANDYDFAIDFEFDGRNDLSDVSIMASSYGASCP